ncbi:MAG TPA: energy transducer TonB [Steroidobacteraceae bacterium]|nr:energy transducer TonB [Steroidobacteraceae bacterium]
MAAVHPYSLDTASHASRRIGLLAAVTLHAFAGAALLSYEPSRQALSAAVPIMVDLITPPKVEARPEPPVEVPPPPKPKPVRKLVNKEPEPPPVLAAPVEAPWPIAVAPPPPAPPPPQPAPAPVVVAAAPPVAMTPPIFTADYLENPPPAYPSMSRRLGEQGRVVLRVLVSAGGRADEIQIRESSGHARLDNAARDTVRDWRFVPAKRGETPVPAWVLIPVSFQLER